MMQPKLNKAIKWVDDRDVSLWDSSFYAHWEDNVELSKQYWVLVATTDRQRKDIIRVDEISVDAIKRLIDGWDTAVIASTVVDTTVVSGKFACKGDYICCILDLRADGDIKATDEMIDTLCKYVIKTRKLQRAKEIIAESLSIRAFGVDAKPKEWNGKDGEIRWYLNVTDSANYCIIYDKATGVVSGTTRCIKDEKVACFDEWIGGVNTKLMAM